MAALRLTVLVLVASFLAVVESGDKVVVPLMKLTHVLINTQYAGVVKFGNQNFLLVFDSSSCNVIVASQECVGGSCRCERVQRYFNPSAKVLASESKEVKFFDYGTATGKAIEISLSIVNLTSSKQGIVLADEVSDDWCYLQVDGVAGLGTPGCSNPFGLDSLGLFSNIVNENNIDPIFSIHHARFEDGEHFGELIFGGSDTRYIEGGFTYVDLIDDSSWQFKIDGIKIGETAVTPDFGEAIVGFIDTSKAIILGPASQVYQIYEATGCHYEITGGQTICKIDCDKISSLPELTFTIAGRDFNVSAEYYVQKYGTLCSVGVRPCDDSDSWKIGDYFIDHYYTEYNWEKKQIGLATAIESL